MLSFTLIRPFKVLPLILRSLMYLITKRQIVYGFDVQLFLSDNAREERKGHENAKQNRRKEISSA